MLQCCNSRVRLCVHARARRTRVGVPIVSRPQSVARASASSIHVPERRRSTRRPRRSTRGSHDANARSRDDARVRVSSHRGRARARDDARCVFVGPVRRPSRRSRGVRGRGDVRARVEKTRERGVRALELVSATRRDDRETRGDGVRRGRVRGRDDERRDDGAVSRARGVVVVDDVA